LENPTLTTRILMSFGMAEGGMMFVQWLRNRLMKDFGLYSLNSVYVDFVTARAGDAVYGVKLADAPPHYAAVNLDTRDHMESVNGARPIGAMHPDWEAMFNTAMSEAEVVIFVVNDAFEKSPWCPQELDNFKVLLAKRPKLRGIVLDVDGKGFDAAARGLPPDRIAVISGGREARQGGMLWEQGLWAISEPTYRQLLKAIGRHSHWKEGRNVLIRAAKTRRPQ
jgi:hypothetical protein